MRRLVGILRVTAGEQCTEGSRVPFAGKTGTLGPLFRVG